MTSMNADPEHVVITEPVADSEIPVFPCTTLHVQAALDKALA